MKFPELATSRNEAGNWRRAHKSLSQDFFLQLLMAVHYGALHILLRETISSLSNNSSLPSLPAPSVLSTLQLLVPPKPSRSCRGGGCWAGCGVTGLEDLEKREKSTHGCDLNFFSCSFHEMQVGFGAWRSFQTHGSKSVSSVAALAELILIF